MEKAFNFYLTHPRIAIIAIQKHCVDAIKSVLQENVRPYPAVIVIPSRHEKYILEEDPLIQKAIDAGQVDDLQLLNVQE